MRLEHCKLDPARGGGDQKALVEGSSSSVGDANEMRGE